MESEEDKMFDELLRAKLGSYKEPPPMGVWQGIAQKLPYKPFGKFFPGSDGGIIISLLGIVIVAAGLVYFFAGNLDSNASRYKQIKEELTHQNSLDKIEWMTSNGNEGKPALVEKAAPDSKKNLPLDSKKTTVSRSSKTFQAVNTGHYYATHPEKIKNATGSTSISKKGQETKKQINAGLYSIPEEKVMLYDPFAYANMELKPTPLLASRNNTYYIQTLRTTYSGYDFRENSKRRGTYFTNQGTYCMTAFYRPEFLKNAANEAYASQRQAVGLSLRYSRNLVVLETGLEYNQESRTQSYDVQYFNFLGTYKNLDSITFNPQGPQLNPTYHFTLDTVYSPELSNGQFSKPVQYAFLKVPVMIGMEKQLGSFTFGIKGGLMFGFLVYQSDKSFNNQYPEDRIYQYEKSSPSYLSSSIQWVLKADIDWQIRPNFGINVCPMINEYLTDPYESGKQTIDSPVYWGIQGGLFYKW